MSFLNKKLAPNDGVKVGYVGGTGVITSLDITDLTNISVLDTYTGISGEIRSLSLDRENDVLYASADQNDSVVALNVASSTNLSLLEEFSNVVFNNTDVVFLDPTDSGILYVGSSVSPYYFVGVDCSNPDSMSVIDSLTPVILNPTAMYYDTVREKIVVFDKSYDISVIDTHTNPLSYSAVGNLNDTPPAPGWGGGFDQTRDWAFMVDPAAGNLVATDISNYTTMTLDYTLSLASYAQPFSCVYYEGGETVFVWSGANTSLVSVDVSTVASMSVQDELATPSLSSVYNMYVDEENDHLYVCDRSASALRVYDISDPTAVSYIDGIVDTTNLLTAVSFAK